MSKRKIVQKLEISDFRGLGATRTLDFDGADIVLLLGLNGFGKTSVFDSIEWGLTGKLGRYERYNEPGRRQDFGREKEVLRNKYATQPNTYVKIFLEDGSIFGRRVLSNGSESDYNMGSIIEGCEYGLSSLSKENIKDDLANSYFSATHILSQETINHFVTSKKPEERYKALSVNFGTSIFSPFESNIQAVLSKLADAEKEVVSQIKAKEDTVSALTFRVQSQEEDISAKVDEANRLIEAISAMSGAVFHAPLSFTRDAVLLDANFEKYVINSKSRASLAHSELKERLTKISFLKDRANTWMSENSELKTIEKAILDTRALLIEIEELQRSISASSKELLEISAKLDEAKSKKVQIESALQHVNHYVSVRKRVLSIERAIQKRNASLSVAKGKIPELAAQIEKFRRELAQLKSRGNATSSIIERVKENKSVLTEYENRKSGITADSEKLKSDLAIIKSRSETIRSLVKNVENLLSNPAAIQELVKREDYAPLLQAESVDQLDRKIELLSNNEKLLEGVKADVQALEGERKTLKEQLSKSRLLLSEAMSLIDRRTPQSQCPVCDTSHETSKLLAHIESKLGDGESKALQRIDEKLSTKAKEQDDLISTIGTTKQAIDGCLDGIKRGLLADLSSSLEIESKQEAFAGEKQKLLSELEIEYRQVISSVDEFLENKPRDFAAILAGLEQISGATASQIQVHDQAINVAQTTLDTHQGVVKTASDENASDLAEIETIKDSKFDEIREFLEKHGLRPESESIEKDVQEYQSHVLEAENGILTRMRDAELKGKELKAKVDTLLNGKSEGDFKKGILIEEEKASKLKKSLGLILDHLSSLEMSPAAYTKESIERLEVETTTALQKTLDTHTALEGLVAHIATFKKFNSDSEVRKKGEAINGEISALKLRREALDQVKGSINKLKKKYPSAMQGLIKDNLDVDLFNKIYGLLNPHRRFKIIDFDVDVAHNRIGINFNAKHSKIEGRPEYLFSSAQLNTFGICMFLSMALRQNWLDFDTILIDDPIQNLDDINILSFIDFLRGLLDSDTAKKQVILSTHDERFYGLMLKKFQDYKIKTFKFESYGKLVPDVVSMIE